MDVFTVQFFSDTLYAFWELSFHTRVSQCTAAHNGSWFQAVHPEWQKFEWSLFTCLKQSPFKPDS